MLFRGPPGEHAGSRRSRPVRCPFHVRQALLALALLLLLSIPSHETLSASTGGEVPRAWSGSQVLSGRVVLPEGEGSRGVEILATLQGKAGEHYDAWSFFDEHGLFEDTFEDSLVRITFTTGIRYELLCLEGQALPAVDHMGRIELGEVDLRPHVVEHGFDLHAAPKAPIGEVRIALFFGLPYTGPNGEPVALGSKQFPPRRLGEPVDWLLPPLADSLYFLVERPDDPVYGRDWRSGRQRLFGPYNSGSLPEALYMD